MDVIPLLHLRQQILSKETDISSVRKLLDDHSLSSLYIFDEQGILKNRPSVDFYQGISKIYELWVDAGPRETGDIVDLVFSGVKNIILRPSIWIERTIESVRDLTEHPVFCQYTVDVTQRNPVCDQYIPMDDFDGVIVLIHGDWDNRRFSVEEKIKQLAKKKNSYVLSSDYSKQSYWKSIGFDGVLIDINKLSEVID